MPKGSRDEITKSGLVNTYSLGPGGPIGGATRIGQAEKYKEQGTELRKYRTATKKSKTSPSGDELPLSKWLERERAKKNGS